MNDIYNKINDYNLSRNTKILILFDKFFVDMINNRTFSQIVTELSFSKLNIYLVFITKTYFRVLKEARLNCTHFFVIKISDKKDLQQ